MACVRLQSATYCRHNVKVTRMVIGNLECGVLYLPCFLVFPNSKFVKNLHTVTAKGQMYEFLDNLYIALQFFWQSIKVLIILS